MSLDFEAAWRQRVAQITLRNTQQKIPLTPLALMVKLDIEKTREMDRRGIKL